MSGSVSMIDGHIDEVTTGKTCKDCLYYECCSSLNKEFKKYPKDYIGSDLVARNCSTFKDKSRFIELPCKVGDTVYQFCETFGVVLPYFVETLNIGYYDKNKVCYQYEANCCNDEENELLDSIDFEPNDIGKTVFLTKEESEAKLKELQI